MSMSLMMFFLQGHVQKMATFQITEKKNDVSVCNCKNNTLSDERNNF